jgi:hypothetical protein
MSECRSPAIPTIRIETMSLEHPTMLRPAGPQGLATTRDKSPLDQGHSRDAVLCRRRYGNRTARQVAQKPSKTLFFDTGDATRIGMGTALTNLMHTR